MCWDLHGRGRSMTGRFSSLVNRVQNLALLAKRTHCMIHRESLAAKKMPECIETVLKQAVQIINFIKARPLNARLFPFLCQELGAKHEQLLFQTEVRWLSRGQVLHRIYELRSEVMTFLVNVQSDLVQYLGCFSFLICASSFPFLASFPRVLAPPLQDAREGSKEKTQGRRNRSK